MDTEQDLKQQVQDLSSAIAIERAINEGKEGVIKSLYLENEKLESRVIVLRTVAEAAYAVWSVGLGRGQMPSHWVQERLGKALTEWQRILGEENERGGISK